MRSIALLLASAACGEPLIHFEPPDADGARSEVLALHTASGLEVHAFSRDEPFAFRFSAVEPFSAESFLYDESLEELGIPPGELSFEEGPSRGLPPPRRILRQEIDLDEGAEGWSEVGTISDEAANFRIAGSCALLDERGLIPFAAEAVAIDTDDDRAGEGEVQILRIAMIDEDSLLALTNNHLHLIRRGEPYEPTEAVRFGADHLLRSFDFDRESGRVWVVGAEWLYELSVDASGLSAVSSTTGCTSGTPNVYEEVVVDDRGRPIVASDLGAVCRWDPGWSRLPPIIPLFNSVVVSMVRTADSDHPLLAGTGSRIHLYDAAATSWEIAEGLPDLSAPFLPFALASSRWSGQLENWAGGTDGKIFRQRELRGWAAWPIRYPPDHAPCGHGRYPEIRDEDEIRTIYPLEDRLLITLGFCSAIVELDPTGRCSRLATVGGTTATQSDTFHAIDARGNTVVVGGDKGLLYTVPLAR